jgi:uncharacterized OB-fold protein
MAAGRLAGEEAATALSRPYWRALREGRFELQRCHSCGRRQHYPRSICSHCGARELSWAPASPRGTVLAATVVHRSSKDALADRIPYDLALVRMADAPLLMALLAGDAGDYPIGTAVAIDFDATRESGLLTVR